MPRRKPPLTVTLREPIGRAWHDEPVWLPLPGPGPFAAVDSASGECLPGQLCGAAPGEEGVQPPRLCVRLSLAPDESRTLRLRRRRAVPAAVENPFRIAVHDGAWEIGNGFLSVRVPCSAPFVPGPVPGPVLALRQGDEGRWRGRGLWGPSAFVGDIDTRVIDRGPLYARWRVRYLVGGSEVAAYDCTLWAGEDLLMVRDRTQADAGLAFRFLLAGEDAPAEWFLYGGGEQVGVQRGPLTAPPSPKGVSRPGEIVHIDFHSGHQQMSYTWAGFLAPGAPAIGVCELNGGHWHVPGRQRIRALREGDGMALVFSVNGGSKEFGLACGDPDAYAPAAGLSRFCHLRRRHSDLPLDRVRHWVTEWPLAPRPARPLLYPAGSAERWAERLAAWPELGAGFRRLLPLLEERGKVPESALLPLYSITGDVRVRDRFLAWTRSALDAAVARAVDNGYLRLIIFDGRALKVILEGLDLLRWRGELESEDARRFARQIAFLAYCFHDPNFWPWDSCFRERSDPRGHGGDYWEDIGDSVCPPNFATEYWSSFLLAGLAYPEHPAADGWIRDGCDLLERQLERHFYESGGYCESLNYHAHEVVMFTQAVTALLAAGHADFFAHPRIKANYEFLTRMAAPPARLTPAGEELTASPLLLNPPANGRAVLLTNWGNSGHDCSGYLMPQTVAVAAGLYAARDPAFAARLMTAWRRSPQPFCTHYSAFNLLALGDPGLPDADPGCCSERVDGLGANLRANVGTPDEIYGWVKGGLATHHNCRDEGGLVLYAYGAPVIGDFGYHTHHEGRQESGYETWKHTCVTFAGHDTCAALGCEQTLPPEYWASTPEADLLVLYLPQDYIIPAGRPYLDAERCPRRIEHRRYLLFIKDPGCFLIYDHIPESCRPSTWWCHALADAVETRPQGARFRGRYGVDLDVQVLLPAPAAFSTGVYSVQQHLRIDQPGPGDYLTLLTPLRPNQSPPVARFEAATGTLFLGPDGRDRVRFNPCGVRTDISPAGARLTLERAGRLILADPPAQSPGGL